MTYTELVEAIKDELQKLYAEEPEDPNSGKAVRTIDAALIRITGNVFEFVDANRGRA